MAGKTKRAALVLSPDQEAMLRRLVGSRTAPVREVERARILLGYAQGIPIDRPRPPDRGQSADYLLLHRQGPGGGRAAGLTDAYHRPHEPEISDEARAWVVSVACTKPVAHGLAAELWSIAGLARFVADHSGPGTAIFEDTRLAKGSGSGKEGFFWPKFRESDGKSSGVSDFRRF